MVQVISIILSIIGLIIATSIYGCCEESALADRQDEAFELYRRELEEVKLPPDFDASLSVPSDLQRFSEEYLPLLHSKWEQIQGEYTVINRNLKLMQVKCSKLQELNELNDNKIDLSGSKFYVRWQCRQKNRLAALERAHRDILAAVEKYYAEAQIRNIDSDAEVKQQVAGLIRGANAVLKESGLSVEPISEQSAAGVPSASKKEAPPTAPEKSAPSDAGRNADAPAQPTSSNAAADFAEGIEWQHGKNGRSKNLVKAAACYRRAAEAGHAAAQNNIGHFYHRGWGVSKDLNRAAHWYRLSAEQGDAFGQSNYGTCLEFGWGVRANKPEAIEWYRKAARQGHASAQKHLRRLGMSW